MYLIYIRMRGASVFVLQAEDGIRDLVRSRGLGEVYKRQGKPQEQRLQRRSLCRCQRRDSVRRNLQGGGSARGEKLGSCFGQADGQAAAVGGVGTARIARSGDGVTQVDAVLSAAPGSDAARASVRDLRTAVSGFDETYVGGSEATALDRQSATTRDRLLILPVILALVLLAVIGLLRPIVAPDILASLLRIPDFVRAYEVDGMTPAEFDDFGATRKTLRQFLEANAELDAIVRDVLIPAPVSYTHLTLPTSDLV